jgi:TonB family protein
MTPSTNWVLDYAEDSCALRRNFESSGEQATLELRQFGPGDSVQVILVSDTLSRTGRAPRVRFEPDDDYFEPMASLLLDDGQLGGVMYSDTLRPPALKGREAPDGDWPEGEREARERAITGLSVTGSFERALTLRTGTLGEPMKAMRTCLDELLTHWGLDAAAQRTRSRPVKPIDQMTWAKRVRDSYPTEMLRANKSGRVNIRLIVGPDGRPSSCIPQKGSANFAFEEHACKMAMQYARFEPALDAAGSPIPSFISTAIIYQVSR